MLQLEGPYLVTKGPDAGEQALFSQMTVPAVGVVVGVVRESAPALGIRFPGERDSLYGVEDRAEFFSVCRVGWERTHDTSSTFVLSSPNWLTTRTATWWPGPFTSMGWETVP